MDNSVRKTRVVSVVSHLVVVEAGIGRYNRILRLNGQREVEAVMDRVVEVDRQPCGGSSKSRHRGGRRDRNSLLTDLSHRQLCHCLYLQGVAFICFAGSKAAYQMPPIRSSKPVITG